MPTKPVRELERLTVLLDHAEIKTLKYMAVDQGVSTSEIVRSAVGSFFSAREAQRSSAGSNDAHAA
jgi:hypothetical protein